MARQFYIEVIERKTGQVIHTVDCRGKSPATVDRVESGMWINMDMERYFTKRRNHPRKQPAPNL